MDTNITIEDCLREKVLRKEGNNAVWLLENCRHRIEPPIEGKMTTELLEARGVTLNIELRDPITVEMWVDQHGKDISLRIKLTDTWISNDWIDTLS